MSETQEPALTPLAERPLAERLGFGRDERVAIIHTDDIGMCHAANVGAFAALREGPATCGSIMVPCPWFQQAAAWAREDPQLDLGVHLTLNAEWEHYRWGPVAGRNAVPSLCAPDGGLRRSSIETLQNAKPEEVKIELRAQIQMALDAGIDVTHIDSHMGTVFLPPFVDIYVELAREFDVPAFGTRPRTEQLGDGPMAGTLRKIHDLMDELEADGFPVIDHFDADSLSFEAGGGREHNLARLARLRPGVTYLICHPARGGEELSAISEDAHCRDFEAQFYGGKQGTEALESEGVRRVGMRALRDLMRAAPRER